MHLLLPLCVRSCRGMLPGFVSGFYSYDDCHIDLTQLSRYARASLVQAEATGIDIQVRGWSQDVHVQCSSKMYKVLSTNSTAQDSIPHLAGHSANPPLNPVQVTHPMHAQALYTGMHTQACTCSQSLLVYWKRAPSVSAPLHHGLQGRRVLLPNGASQPYDVLSINIGITPAASSIPGAAQHTIPVKPIDK